MRCNENEKHNDADDHVVPPARPRIFPQHKALEGIHDFSLADALLGLGFQAIPRKYSSTDVAALRPSAMAHTTRDWPRRASPAANIPGTDVWQSCSLAATFPRASSRTPNSSIKPDLTGPVNP